MKARHSKKKGVTSRKTNYAGPYLKSERFGEEFYVEIGDQKRKPKGSKLTD